MAGDLRAAHAACIAALGALEGAATAALAAGAVDELRPLAARLIEARRLLEALPVDEAPPPHLAGSAGGGGVRRAVELCIWEVRARLRLLEGYAAGASGAALDDRKRTALLRLMRSLVARLNGEPDPDPPTPPGARPTSPPLAPDAPAPAPSAPSARTSGSGAAPSSPAATPLSPSPSPPSAPSARSKLPKLNMGAAAAAAAALPQSVEELAQETPRSAFFMRREAPTPPPAATPRTRDETRRKAVAEGDAAVSAGGPALPATATATATTTGTGTNTGTGTGEVVMERDASGAWLVQGGAVTRLIERASAPDCADASFGPLFLLTFRTFLSPDLLLARLLERHALPPPAPCPERWKHDVLRPVQARVAALLRQWLDLEAAEWCPALRPALAAARPALAAAGHDALVQRIDALLAQPAPAPAAPAPPPSPRGIGPSESFLALPPLDVARFLCRSDAALLAGVRHTELLSHGWARAEWADRCPALSKVIARFNALSHWLCSLVLTLDTPRLRAKMYARWVKIAVELRRQGDFAAVMAVVAALHNPAVARLKATLREVPRKRAAQVEELEALMRPTSNFRAYREALLLAPLPCVPYVGVFLTDLTFIEDGNPDWLAPGVVNFRKRRMLGEVLLLVQRLQSVPYAFPRSPAVDTFVEAQLGISHDVKRLFELSLQREPRQP